jgi:hypothetical protein
MRKLKNTLTYANVVATLGVFLAISGSALAVSTVTKNSVTSRSIKDAAVRTQDVKDDSLTGADVDEGSLSVRPSGPAAGDLTGAYPAPTIAPNAVGSDEVASNSIGSDELKPDSVGSEEVKPDSLGGGDIQESTLGEVPAATLGGIGRYGFDGGCNPETTAFVPCSVVNVNLPKPARMLVIGTAQAHGNPDSGTAASAHCRIGTTSGPVEASKDFVRITHDEGLYDNLTVMAVTGVFPAGSHSLGIDCNQASGSIGIDFPQARVSAVALSAD